MARDRAPASAMSVAFDVVFGVFALSMLVIAVLAVRWGVQRDRAERARRAAPGDTTPVPPPSR